jgi:hypothetical protein
MSTSLPEKMSELPRRFKPFEPPKETSDRHPLQRFESPDPGLSAVIHVSYRTRSADNICSFPYSYTD